MKNKTTKFKVLFIASWFPSRVRPYLGIFIKRKAEAVSKFCDVALIYAIEDPKLINSKYEIDYNIENNIPIVRVYFQKTYNKIFHTLIYGFRFFKSYFLALNKINKVWGKPDFVHANVIERAGQVALIFKYIFKLNYVITEHSTPEVDFTKGITTIPNNKFSTLKSLIIKKSKFINVDSNLSLKYLQKLGYTGNFYIVQNVVDVTFNNFNQKLKNKIIALHISFLNERKNVIDIIEVISEIYFNFRNDFEFHIVGEGELKNKLIEQAQSLNTINKCIFFHGSLSENDKNDLFQQSDFHILNSNEEGFSVVTAESISFGKPVIATKCGGPEDFVIKDVGLLINRNNKVELKNAILYMLENYKKFDKNFLQDYGKKLFSSEVVGLQTFELYKKHFQN